MSNIVGSVTFPTAGNGIGVTGVGFQPNECEIRIAAKNGSTTGQTQLSVGACDSGYNQHCASIFEDGTGRKTDETQTKAIQHWERSGGTITKVLDVQIVSWDSDGFTVNVNTNNANYQVLLSLRN